MKIIGSQFSPFVRVVRAVCDVYDQPYSLIDTGSFVNMSPENRTLIETHNPLMKVPVLIDGEKIILDSRVIVSYIMSKAAKRSDDMPLGTYPLSYTDENLVTVIYGIADSGVLRFILGNTSALPMDAGYMLRSLERMKGGMTYLENSEHLGQNFGLAELSLICMLEWFEKRNVLAWDEYTRLGQIYDKYQGEACLVATRIPD